MQWFWHLHNGTSYQKYFFKLYIIDLKEILTPLDDAIIISLLSEGRVDWTMRWWINTILKTRLQWRRRPEDTWGHLLEGCGRAIAVSWTWSHAGPSSSSGLVCLSMLVGGRRGMGQWVGCTEKTWMWWYVKEVCFKGEERNVEVGMDFFFPWNQ